MPFRFGRAFLLLFKINTHRLPDEIVEQISEKLKKYKLIFRFIMKTVSQHSIL